MMHVQCSSLIAVTCKLNRNFNVSFLQDFLCVLLYLYSCHTEFKLRHRQRCTDLYIGLFVNSINSVTNKCMAILYIFRHRSVTLCNKNFFISALRLHCNFPQNLFKENTFCNKRKSFLINTRKICFHSL